MVPSNTITHPGTGATLEFSASLLLRVNEEITDSLNSFSLKTISEMIGSYVV